MEKLKQTERKILVEEVSQKKIAYDIFFCDTSSTSVTKEEAPVAEGDTVAQTWKKDTFFLQEQDLSQNNCTLKKHQISQQMRIKAFIPKENI